jgi:hypothetical protein
MASEERLSAVMPAELATEQRQRDPFSWYAQMREVGPVVYDPDRDAYDVFHYDEFVDQDALPRSTTGKVVRADLEEWEQAGKRVRDP